VHFEDANESLDVISFNNHFVANEKNWE